MLNSLHDAIIRPGVTAQLIQLAASLAAILLLAWGCGKLGLGGDVRLRDEAEARRLAGEALCGFEATDRALDRAGIGALLALLGIFGSRDE